MAEEQSKATVKSPGVTPNRGAIYQKVVIRVDEILKVLFEKLYSKTESISLGAANKLIDKILPDLKAAELTGENNGPVVVKVVYERNLSGSTDQELPKATVDLRLEGEVQDRGQGEEIRTDQRGG